MKMNHGIVASLAAFYLSGTFLAAQNQTSDGQFLAMYSYPIFAVAGTQQYTGTAFFYRSNDTAYLVSNYHAIKGMSPLKQSISFKTDSLYLKYPVKRLNGSNRSYESKVMAIDISDEVTGQTEIFSMVNRIDLLKIPVDVPDDAKILFINDLIDTNYLETEPEEVLVFGFPPKSGPVPAFYSRQQRLEGKINPEGFNEYTASLQSAASDSARAVLSGTARYYYFIRPYAAQGYSGAPVFGKFRAKDDQIIYRFIGVVFAGQPATKQTWAIRGDVALRYLEGG